MKKFQIRWDKISKELALLRDDCIAYLTEELNKEENKNGISCEPDGGGSVCVTYDGGRHPEYDSNPYSTVKGVYLKDGKIMLDTEDCDEYSIDRIDTVELLGVCDFIEEYCL